MTSANHEGAVYRQLARVLRDRIRNVQLPAGGRIPSEKDLQHEFGLARETVRRALAVLRTEGLVEVRQGDGTYVVDAPPIVHLQPGDTVTSSTALTPNRANGDTEIYPAGTMLVVNVDGRMRAPIAAAVIVSDGRVLMIRRRIKEGELSWQFPAGEVEAGESPDDAAVREAREETGLAVHATKRLGERVHPATGRAMFYVACDVIAGTAYVRDDEELAEVAWCDRSTLASYGRHAFHRPVQEYLDAALR